MLNKKTLKRLTKAGVIITDPATAYIDDDAQIGKGTTILPMVVISKDVTIGENCTVGPFAYLRPGTVLKDKVKVGDFVEIKNSVIGEGTKLSHLTYVGDADVGERVNFGCGTVVVNYDGVKKNRTTIEDDCFIGCNTNLISPVTVKKWAYTAAGSTINKEVPEGALAIARAKQENKPGWAIKKRNPDK